MPEPKLRPSGSAPGPAVRTVLVAEDDLVSIRLLERHLQSWGYTVIPARNGEDAWAILREADVRLALLDWMMPKVDGPELCRRVRGLSKDRYTYIILLTSRDQSEDIIAGLEAGADDYMTKPVHFLELQARLQTGQRIIALEDKLRQSQHDLYKLATRDGLTEIWNRTTILEFLDEELVRGRRLGHPTGVIMIDLDHFKEINDTYGHLTGDRVISKAAAYFQKSVRPYDRVGRYGGDEMLVVLPDCGLEETIQVAERLRKTVEKARLRVPGRMLRFTLSLGCASSKNEAGRSVDRMIRESDRALYEAKQNGRNRVAAARDPRPRRKGEPHAR